MKLIINTKTKTITEVWNEGLSIDGKLVNKVRSESFNYGHLQGMHILSNTLEACRHNDVEYKIVK